MASVIATHQDTKQMDSTNSQKRVDWKKQKELEEARKAGTAPPEVDEEGRDINPHIPQYITSVPWYIGANRPTLKHQRCQPEKKKVYAGLEDFYKKGVDEEKISTKFRKGACENCGAVTHKKKDCLERPRKVGARFTGDDIKPDELLPGELNFDYDGKRDRWSGYDVNVHSKVLEEYAKVDEAKRQLKAAQLEEELQSGKKITKLNNDDEEEEKYADEVDMPGQKFDANVRQTVRNLRIREDTAKYLYNLDPNSAFYDAKTRSMRESPFTKGGGAGKMVDYVGDNFVRTTGQVKDIAGAQLFAWEAYERGADVHLQADPTKLELLHKTYKVKKDAFKEEQKGGILEKYGGAEHLESLPKELLLAQTEEYVEYSRSGKVVKGQERAVTKSKYEEDVYLNNHTSVFGSYWNNFQWGYQCCHSFIKMSYCTGEAGKLALKSGVADISPSNSSSIAQKTLVDMHKESFKDKKSKDKMADEDLEAKNERLKKALQKEEEHIKNMSSLLEIDERKRAYNSLNTENREPTQEEMTAYRIKRLRSDDPMAQFLK
ncbi:pre-mRNA-splicing factor SLU7 isoform X2 [Hydra vulgaris]|uniref:Pre-mRNA-splicing factor SLU7 n=1 Tax=Hydra vulgaris TaxID=6087 RepID=A0ABM4BH98_HYDVU